MDYLEAWKLRSYLPQLIASMLACMSQRSNDFQLMYGNRRVQLGFGFEGVKVTRLTIVDK